LDQLMNAIDITGGLAPVDWVDAVKSIFKNTQAPPSLYTIYQQVLGLGELDLHRGLLLSAINAHEDDEKNEREKVKDQSSQEEEDEESCSPLHVLRAMIVQGITYRSNKKSPRRDRVWTLAGHCEEPIYHN